MEMAMVLFATLFIFLFLSAPIYVALTASSLITMFIFGDYSLSAVMQRIFGGMDKFALMSLPFYVLAADIMTVGGMSKKIVDFVNVAMGSFRGSLAIVTQGASMFFGALSGSSPATVVAIGSMMYPRLTNEAEGGYSKRFAAGLITSLGAVAILIPPSITFIIYGATTGVSIAALFAGGLGAGLVFGGLIMLYSYYYALNHHVVVGQKVTSAELIKVTKDASWSLGVPVIIVGGISAGIFTPTEAAGFSVVYALFVCVFIYKELPLSKLLMAMKTSAVTIGQLMMLLGTAGLFGWVLTVSFFPQILAELLTTTITSKYTMLFIVNIMFLIAGMFVDGGAAIMILAPLIFLPMVKLGVDPVHLGVVLVTNLSIGMFTPPFGLNLFVARSVTGLSLGEIYRSVLPFIVISIIALIIITYIPAVSMIFVSLLS
ncbi:TRAP transporter large permease [Cloacibacillus porcorum]|uniref:TRAP transporter large permease n=1 Tax=Cloacibacillus porcorum TaxID=1197717 RepID=UPI0014595A3B|nr:TRAP transporter large permease [Cloacibacillus porcorum]MCC8185717.1 TRAP transporter large permease [Cloacibacillus porcorum]MDY5390521.1 TRAP transporter large permease [Cloacibacillus porcorum]NMF18680.1 TRAP transporter large permease [Cloacibacillus porcorum]